MGNLGENERSRLRWSMSLRGRNRIDRLDSLKRVSFARSLGEPVLRVLASIAVERRVERGTVITLDGEPAEAMYLVVAGRVKVVRYSAEGREQIMHVVEPGDHFNTVPVFDGGPCPATTEALQPSAMLVLYRSAVLELIRR